MKDPTEYLAGLIFASAILGVVFFMVISIWIGDKLKARRKAKYLEDSVEKLVTSKFSNGKIYKGSMGVDNNGGFSGWLNWKDCRVLGNHLDNPEFLAPKFNQ